MLKDENDKKIAYTLIGLGAAISVFAIFKARSASAALAKALNRVVARGNNAPKLEAVEIPSLAQTKTLVPAIVFQYSENGNSLNMTTSKLNFTPRDANTPHNETLNQDLKYLKDPTSTPKDYFKTFEDKGYSRSEIMHPNDFQILQATGVIPKDFPLKRIEIVKSLNGKNLFMVGYSEPKVFNLPMRRTQAQINANVPAQNIKVIRPLWAVSFGKVFNPMCTVADDLKFDNSVLKALTTRLLVAEGMTGRENEGCDYRLSAALCAAEKAALMGIYFQRYRLLKLKDSSSKITAPIYKGQRWNSHSSFMSPYHGWIGRNDKNAESDKRKISHYPQVNRDRASNFYDQYMWSIPNFGNTASHYIHVDAMSDAPIWSWSFRPLNKDSKKYTSQHPIFVGRLLASDNSKDFT